MQQAAQMQEQMARVQQEAEQETAQFHLDLAREPKNADLLADALYDVTGRRLELVFALGEARESPAVDEEPAGEERIYELLQETLDAREREG